MFDVWKNVLAKIEQEISASSYATWFDGVNLVDIKNDVVYIGVPNIFKRKHIKSKYDQLIRDALTANDVSFRDVVYDLRDDAPKINRGREVSVNDSSAVPVRVKKTAIRPAEINTGLSNRYRMDNFVVGSNNDLAVSVAKAVIENPGKKFNPFFLYGGPGLGKTHLVQAIGNEILKTDPKSRVLYMPINQFYTEFVSAVRSQGMEGFRKKYYNEVDVLIIDDFQFIVGKEKSQEEFFHLFNTMHQAGKQIIVTSDRLPEQIKEVDQRLASRLTMGGAFDLQLPSFEDRCAILKSMAEFDGVEIEDEAIEYLAENVKTNIRDLDREFKQIIAMAELRGMTPLELINGGYIDTSTRSNNATISAKKIIDKVAKYYDLTVKEMCSKSRVAHIKTARQVAMYLLSEELHMSTTKIAAEVGVKDHTTVMHGIKKIKSDLKLNFTLREQLSEIRGSLYD